MGQAASSGILASLGGVLSGAAMTALGIFTVNPLLIGMGATSIVAGAVEGTATGLATQHQLDQQADQQRDANSIAQKAATSRANLLNEAQRGAYGKETQEQVTAFAKAAQAGSTIGAAMKSAGMVKGWGTARDIRNTRAIDKHLTGGQGIDMSMRFGDPLHRATALSRKAFGTAGAFLEDDRRAKTHEILLRQNAPPAQQAYNTYSADDSKRFGNAASGGQSLEGRIATGAVQTTAGGDIYSTSS